MKFTKIRWIKLLLRITVFSLVASFFIAQHGFLLGLHLIFLLLSLYIIFLPGAHGQLVIGLPIKTFIQKAITTEPFMWTLSAITIIITNIFSPHVYQKTLFHFFFYQIMSRPLPCLFIIALSGMATWYNFLLSLNNFGLKKKRHKIIRKTIKLLALITFFYLTRKEIIVTLHALF